MLILPLHRPLTRATFPIVTGLLVLLNVFVFALLQSGDGAAEQQAQAWYDESGLATIEAPLFEQYLAETDAGEPVRQQLADAPEPMRPLYARHLAQTDAGFRATLASGEAFDDDAQFGRWQPADQQFRELQDKVFTSRFAFSGDEPRVLQLFSSMFLHGSIDHLLGNMLFLVALGLLVEGPLGGGVFAGLYLLSGAGAGLAWLGIDGHGTVIGASGAIAGLMGAFCVVWGLRRVRFFYWFFVVFDYVKAPALVLLPLWLGWELLQMWLSDGSRVAYSAHAGGIVAGAALALLVRQAGWHDERWLQAQDDDVPDADALYRNALAHLGRMQLAEAGHLLDQASAIAPERFDIGFAQLRCARYSHDVRRVAELAARLLSATATRPADSRDLATLLLEQPAADWSVLPPGPLADLGLRLASSGEPDMALTVFARIATIDPAPAEMPQRWLQLAFALRDSGHAEPMRQALTRLVERHPQSPQANKARFLLNPDVASLPSG